jgi:hypothetical protein
MATKTEKGPSKTTFVRDLLRKNSTANRKAVEEAWREAGHEGPISSALVSNLRRELGLTGNQRDDSRPTNGNATTEPPKAKARKSRRKKRRRSANGKASGLQTTPATERKPRSGGRDKAIAEIEGDIDRLIFKLMDVGGMEEIEGGLRKVRRLLYRSSQA